MDEICFEFKKLKSENFEGDINSPTNKNTNDDLKKSTESPTKIKHTKKSSFERVNITKPIESLVNKKISPIEKKILEEREKAILEKTYHDSDLVYIEGYLKNYNSSQKIASKQSSCQNV